MEISRIAESILSGIDNLEIHTPILDRLNSDYLRNRKEIVMEHLRQITQQKDALDNRGPCDCPQGSICELFRKKDEACWYGYE